MSVTLVHWKHMQRNGVKRFRSAPNLGIFVKEVFEVVGEVNDALLHLGDAAPPIELNFTEELWVVCHLDDHPAGGSLEGATGNSKKVWPNNSRVVKTRSLLLSDLNSDHFSQVSHKPSQSVSGRM